MYIFRRMVYIIYMNATTKPQDTFNPNDLQVDWTRRAAWHASTNVPAPSLHRSK